MSRMGLKNIRIHEAQVNTEENISAKQEGQHGGVKFSLTNLCYLLK